MAQNGPEKLAKKIKNFIYHPADSIGSGFSSQVFKGVNELEADPTRKGIAIKVIELSKIKNEVENYLLNNEVNALKLLKHPNILQTVEVLMTKNNVYIITEFCEGGDILKHIKSHGPFQEAQALALIKDVIEGYKCIEEHKIIHRDLKTSNIFLSKGKAKIADFGFCEFVGEKKPQIAYNVGSPAYMSPEAYKENIYSHKTDMWAIGIIFYELLVGDTPDRTQTYTEMTTNLMNGKINNIQNDSIRAMLALCFKKNPNERIDATSLSELVSIELNKQRSAEVQSMNVNQSDQGNIFKTNFQMPSNMSPSSKNKDIKFFKAEIPSNPKIPNIPLNRGSQQNIFERSEQPPSRRSLSKEKIESQSKENLIKSHTDYLLFLYRLLKFVAELKAEKTLQTLLPIFRHKNYIDSLVEEELKRVGASLEVSEGNKEFQYLKSRFEEVYVQHTRENTGNKNNFKEKLDSLSNVFFLHPDAIQFYRAVFKDAGSECINILEGKEQTQLNKSQVGIVLDYLIIEHELLGLHLEGISLPDVVVESNLNSIIKEKPKKLTASHLQVLKLKFNYFMGSSQQTFNTEQVYQIPNIPNGLPHPQIQSPSLPLNNLIQNPIPKESYSQRSHTTQNSNPTIVNGIQNEQIFHMLMGQQIPVQNPSFGHPQQQIQGHFQQSNQYPTVMSQIPIHQSIVMNKWP